MEALQLLTALGMNIITTYLPRWAHQPPRSIAYSLMQP